MTKYAALRIIAALNGLVAEGGSTVGAVPVGRALTDLHPAALAEAVEESVVLALCT